MKNGLLKFLFPNKQNTHKEEIGIPALITKSENNVQKLEYHFPPLNLLSHGKRTKRDSDNYLRETALQL